MRSTARARGCHAARRKARVVRSRSMPHSCASGSASTRDRRTYTRRGRNRAPHPYPRRKHMAVMMMMDWPGVTREQYEDVCRIVNFEGDHPKGGLYHVAAVDDKGLHVTDVWERPEDFQAF